MTPLKQQISLFRYST